MAEMTGQNGFENLLLGAGEISLPFVVFAAESLPDDMALEGGVVLVERDQHLLAERREGVEVELERHVGFLVILQSVGYAFG